MNYDELNVAVSKAVEGDDEWVATEWMLVVAKQRVDGGGSVVQTITPPGSSLSRLVGLAVAAQVKFTEGLK